MIKPPSTPARRSYSAQTVRQRFQELEHQVRTTLCLSGISRIVSLLFGGMIVCGLSDWLFHINDTGVRFLIGLALAAGVGWTAWRWLWSPLAEHRAGSSLAALLERRRPYIGNQLSSAAEFLEHGLDPRIGSPLLQQAVIDQAEHRLESLDIEGLVDRRDVRTHALMAAAVCAAAVALLVCFPSESATAVTRLLFPFKNTPWPRHVQLQLVEHDLVPWRTDRQGLKRAARGDTLELYARNLKGQLPEDVVLEYRIGDDRPIREPMRKTILRDEEGRPFDVAGINLPLSRGPILLRAIGGDDDRMEFLPVEVVLPPEIADLHIRLEPPAYTGRPAETLPAGTGDIQAIFGTRVRLTATASQPVAKSDLVFQGRDRVALQRAEDGISLSAEFSLIDAKVSGYRFDLTTLDGFSSGERSTMYTVRVIQDQTPQVTLEDPAGDLTATADAVLPLRISLKDDLGLTSARLAYVKERNSGSQHELLAQYDDPPTDVRLTTNWPLADLQLAPGERLQFQIEATDNYDLSGPAHIGRSATRTVTIVGADEKKEELTNRLGELLSDLSNSIAVQRRVAEQTGQLPEQLRRESQLRPQDADLLRKLDLEQQRVVHQLLEPGDSVRAQADRLLEEFEANHLSNNETTERLESLAETLTELGKETLPDLQRELTQAQKEAGNASPAATEELAADLEKLSGRQGEALRTLEELEAGLSGWRDRRHVAQQLSGLIETQRSLNRSTRAAAEQQLMGDAERENGSGSPGDNSPPTKDRADTQKLAQRQRSEAEAIDQFRKNLADMAEANADRDPEMSRRLEELAQELEQSGVAGQLRDAASSLSEGRAAQASQQQEIGLKKLEELENVLENRPPDDQELLVKRMEKLEEDLATLQKAEEQLAKDFQKAMAEPDESARAEMLEKLTKRQEVLREDLAEIEQQLERLQLQKPRDAARRAGQQMEDLTKGGQQPGERQESLDEALDDLEQARRELAQERRRAEEELAFEQMLRLKDELQGLALRQRAVFEEVRRLDEQRVANGKLSRPQSKTLAQTAQTEAELSQAIAAMAQRLESVEVLSLALQRLSSRMQNVSDSLEEKQTDEPVQKSLQTIEDQLQRLVAVLDSSTASQAGKPPAESPPDQQQPQENQAAGPPGDVITLITQLELLKDLQSECVQRTAQLEEQRQAGAELTDAEKQELESLQRDQSQLTDLARNLLTRLLQSQPQPGTESKTNKSEPAKEGGL